MAMATFWEHSDVQINAWDKVVEGHHHTVAVVQSRGRIVSSEEHHCSRRPKGAHCGNGWNGAIEVLYSELKAEAALKFDAPSQAKLEPKVEAASESDAYKLVNY
jgi:hypothetical protein